MHIAAEMKVVKAVPPAVVRALQGVLELLQSVRRAVGELADREFAATLENGHRQSHACHARGGNAGAIARADDDRIIVRLQLIQIA